MRRMLLAALGSAALAVAACGDDGESASSDKPLTKAQYISQADRICREVEASTKTYSDQVDKLPAGAGAERVGSILEGGLAETRKGVERLKALRTPTEDKATVEAYFASIDKAIAAYEGLVQAVRAEDEAKARRYAQRADPLFDEQRRLSTRYGFKQCRSL